MLTDRPARLPFLEFLGWQIANVDRLSLPDVLATYERGWRYRHLVELPPHELAFIAQLAHDRQSWLASEFMEFQIDHHRRIHRILNSLNAEFLSECRAYFGGGTLISLDLGEYRTSNDIDFVCAVGTDYRRLRNTLVESIAVCNSNRSPKIILKDGSNLEIERFKADQYGVRMAIIIDGMAIKTEIISEARFELEPPRKPDWSPVECLSIVDCFASKLLANADRYADSSVYARDLIDLAFLRLDRSIPNLAFEKAEAAYRVVEPLKSAISRFQNNPDLRFKCYENLQISTIFRPRLIDGIDLLAEDLCFPETIRTISETGDDIFSIESS